MLNQNELFTIIPQSDYVRMPWKNGLGETLEIAVCCENGEVLYRISKAAVVEDGVFSDFNGLNRTLVLLSGQGMQLTHKNDDAEHCHDLTQPLSMAKFAGGDTTHATLTNGIIEDLNIMTREGRAVSNVTSVIAPASPNYVNSDKSLFDGFYANSDCELLIESEQGLIKVWLNSQQTARFYRVANVTVSSGCGVFINIVRVNSMS